MLTHEAVLHTKQHVNGRINEKTKYQTTGDKGFDLSSETGEVTVCGPQKCSEKNIPTERTNENEVGGQGRCVDPTVFKDE